jgi:START domain-containing protein
VTAFRAAALVIWILIGAIPGFAQASDWEVIAERDEIVVSRRPVQGRSFPQLRAVGEVPGTPYEVLAVLLDVPAHVRWLPDCVESKSLRELDAWRNIIYTRTDAPWPVSDREAIIENEVIFLDPPSKLKVTFEAVPSPDIPRARGTVRMRTVNGFYSVEAIDDRRSLVQYELDADPAGALPAWLVTMQSTRNPFQTVAGLRRRLNETRGQYDAQIAAFPR